MTFAAGFVCLDGVLLCTDSQYTAWNKTFEDKLFTRPFENIGVTFAATGNTAYAKTAIEDSAEAVRKIPTRKQTISTARIAIRQAIKDVMNDYASQEYLDQSQKPDFLIGINDETSVTLFSSVDTAFWPVETFKCHGSGLYMANYLLSFLRFSNRQPVDAVLPMALRALAAAKRHDAYVGGGSQFSVLRPGHTATVINYNLDDSDAQIQNFEERCSSLFSMLCDDKIAEPEFDLRLATFNESMKRLRQSINTPGSSYKRLADSLRQASN